MHNRTLMDDAAVVHATLARVANENPQSRSTWISDQGNCCWLVNDPRSVSAMLRGHGDGREKRYTDFSQCCRQRHPTLSEEALHAGYAEHVFAMDAQIAQRIRRQPLPLSATGNAGSFPGQRMRFSVISTRLIEIALWAVRRAAHRHSR
jgi:hypothetical protein